jgi:hypothetical protein
MAKSKLEYIWLDGTKPTQVLRSKTKIVRTLVARSKNAQSGASTAAQQIRLRADHLTAC